jgi:putative membrane protein
MHPILSALVHLLLTAVSVLIVSKVLPGIVVDSYKTALKFTVVVAILNAVAWYALAPLTIGFAILTLGVGYFIINGLIFLLSARVVDGVRISGCATAAFASIGVSIVNLGMKVFLGHWAP